MWVWILILGNLIFALIYFFKNFPGHCFIGIRVGSFHLLSFFNVFSIWSIFYDCIVWSVGFVFDSGYDFLLKPLIFLCGISYWFSWFCII